MAPLEASIVFGIELGENVTVTLASANLLMLGAVSSPKIIFLFYFYNMAAWGVHLYGRCHLTRKAVRIKWYSLYACTRHIH